MLGLGLSALLLAAPADTSAPAGELRVETRAIARVWLLGAGLDQDALTRAVAARLVGKQILGVGEAAGPSDGLAALCHVTLSGPGLQLEVILNDGRLYQRTIAAPDEGRERAAARLIAATLAAIEDASATPDRRDGIFAPPVATPVDTPVIVPPNPGPPRPDAAITSMEPVPDATPRDRAATRNEPPEATRGGPDALASPHSEPEGIASSRREPAAIASSRREPLALGVALELGPGFGLGAPGAGRGLAAGGAGLRLDLRLPRGLTLAAGFRGFARVRDELALARYRWALLVGHTLRRRGLELALLAGPTLETWQLTRRGAAVAYTTSSSRGAALLLGVLARAAVGGRVQARRLSLRIGGYLEFAGSARSSGHAAQITRRDVQGVATPVFVLGGAELSVGVEVELWAVLRRRR